MAASKQTQQRGPQVTTDPNITIGNPDGLHVRVLKRTDGPYVIFDPRQKPGDNALTDEHGVVLLFKTEEAAVRGAHKFLEAEMGNPQGRWITRETWETRS